LLNEREDALCSIGRNGEINCSACRQPMPILGSNNIYRAYAQNCAHVLCSECLDEHAQDSQNGEVVSPRCPLCFPDSVPAAMADGGFEDSGRDGEHDNYFCSQGHSSKMAALISDIRENLRETKRLVLPKRSKKRALQL